MLIVAGWLSVDPDTRAGYLDGCRAVVEQARAAPGCRDFALSADLVQPDRINVFERWDTDEALHRFRGTGPPDEQSAQLRDAEVTKYRISATEAP